MDKRIDVLGIPIAKVNMTQAVDKIHQFIASGKPHMVVTANAEMVMQGTKDPELRRILTSADLVLADGAGVVWAARHKGTPLPQRVAGADLIPHLLELAQQKGYRVYLLGAAPGIAEKAAQHMQEKFPDLAICGIRDGYFTAQEEKTIIAHIQEAKPHILLVALGVPRQEKWIDQYKEILGVPICIGVGGVFDVFAGVTKRAPVWLQKAGLEWSYRLCKQPHRIIRMMALPKFVFRVIRTK